MMIGYDNIDTSTINRVSLTELNGLGTPGRRPRKSRLVEVQDQDMVSSTRREWGGGSCGGTWSTSSSTRTERQ